MPSLTRTARSVVVGSLIAAWAVVPAAAQSSDAYYEFLVARHLETLGENADALAALERAAEADPASAEVRAEIASFHLRRNEAADAEAAAREALALDDANREAHRVVGLVYAARADAITSRAQQAQARADAREAVTHLERAVDGTSSQTDYALHYTLGRLYMRIGDSAKAVEALTWVVSQNPSSVQGRLELSRAQAASDDLAGAIDTLGLVVDDEPRVASTLGQYQEQAGRLTDAARSYGIAIAIEPMNRELKFRRIVALYSAEAYEQAAAFAAQAQTQHPDDLRFPRLRARAMFDNGASAAALSILEPTARANPLDANTQFALADLYTDAGRHEDAERTLRRLLEAEPANAAVLNYLGYLLADSGRKVDEAVRLVERALDSDPDNPSYLDSLGWAHFRRGDFAQAERYLTPAAERLPDNAVIQDHLGDVFAGQGRWQDAVAAWGRALDGQGNIDRDAVGKKIDDARTKIDAR